MGRLSVVSAVASSGGGTGIPKIVVSQSFAGIAAGQDLIAFDPRFAYLLGTFAGKAGGGGLVGSGTAGGGYIAAYATQAMSPDQFAQYTLNAGAGGDYMGIALRCAGNSAYYFCCGTGSDFFMFKATNGFYGGGLWAGPVVAQPPAGTVIRAEMTGTAWRLLFNGVQVANGNDPDFATGQPGISGRADGTPGEYVTNWSGGEL